MVYLYYWSFIGTTLQQWQNKIFSFFFSISSFFLGTYLLIKLKQKIKVKINLNYI